MLSMTRRIKAAYNNYGFVSAFIYGHQGTGKTTYALKVLREVYGNWDQAAKHTYFHLDPLITDIKKAFDADERIPAVLLDDAGIALLKYRWQKAPEMWFAQFFNLARSVIAGILFTSVESGDIIKFVRDKVRYSIPIFRSRFDRSWAIAKGYEIILRPNMSIKYRLVFEDKFRVNLPGNIRQKYNKKRKKTLGNLLSTQQKAVSEAEILKRARELQKEGKGTIQISKIIEKEFGFKRSYYWYWKKLKAFS